MVLIRHDRLRSDIDTEYLTQFEKAFFDPTSAIPPNNKERLWQERSYLPRIGRLTPKLSAVIQTAALSASELGLYCRHKKACILSRSSAAGCASKASTNPW